MAKQTVPDLKELFKQAADIAQQVPDAMQAAAFNRAVDLLTGAGTAVDHTPRRQKSRLSTAAAAPKDQQQETGSLTTLLREIDSTQHPGVRSTSDVLARALMVLQIARTEHEVDGLLPSEIARILTEKFRLNAKDSSVRMALGRATNLVNRVQQGKAFVYRIMGPGEDYLAHLGTGEKALKPAAARGGRKTTPRARQGSDEQPRKSKSESDHSPARPKKMSSGKAGPKSIILSLVQEGYFDAPKTAPQILQHVKTKRGFDLGLQQVSLTLLRLVRDSVLERDTNSEGQYEYRRPKA